MLAAAAAGVTLVFVVPGRDHELPAGGAYQVARRVPGDHNVSGPSSLRAGTLLDDQEGVTGTVSVKLLNGVTSLAIDGKVDASTSADMLTQKALAHLPLLLHEQPSSVAIVGLGSGVTLASALVHPIERVDIIELSPEVVKAANNNFVSVNRDALADARTRLIVGDARHTCRRFSRPTT